MNKERLQKLLNLTKALEDSIRFIYQYDAKSIWRFSGYQTYVQKYNQLATEVIKELEFSEGLINLCYVDKIPGWADAFANQ